IAPSLAITSTFLAAILVRPPAFLSVYYLMQPTRVAACAYTIVIAYALAAGFPNVCSTLLAGQQDRKSTRLNSSHVSISYAVFCFCHRVLHSFPTRRSSDLIAPSLAITSTFLAAILVRPPAFLSVYYLMQPTRVAACAYTIVIAYALAAGFPNVCSTLLAGQ